MNGTETLTMTLEQAQELNEVGGGVPCLVRAATEAAEALAQGLESGRWANPHAAPVMVRVGQPTARLGVIALSLPDRQHEHSISPELLEKLATVGARCEALPVAGERP